MNKNIFVRDDYMCSNNWVELSDGSTIGGMLFADDFVGVSNSEEELQRLCGACLLL